MYAVCLRRVYEVLGRFVVRGLGLRVLLLVVIAVTAAEAAAASAVVVFVKFTEVQCSVV